MIHGDAQVVPPPFVTIPVQVDPLVLKMKPGLFPITRQGARLYEAAFSLYEAVLASPLDISPQAFAAWQHPEVAQAVHALLDCCHDLLERREPTDSPPV